MEHGLTLQSWQTVVEYETKILDFDIQATKAIVKSETVSLGTRYLLVSKFGDKQTLHVTSDKLFVIKRRYDRLEFFDC